VLTEQRGKLRQQHGVDGEFGRGDPDSAGRFGAKFPHGFKLGFDLIKMRPMLRSRRSPASVGETLRVVRVRSRTPSRSSSSRMVCLSADCDTRSFATALVKLRSRPTATRIRPLALSRHQRSHSAHAGGHEYCGVVEEVGKEVRSIKPGQFVIGSFFASDNTCPHCHNGYQTSCQHREFVGGAQAPFLRVPLADGTLVATPDISSEDLIPSLLATSDVLGTGWFAADAAQVKPGMTVAVVGDGAVGLLGVLSAKQMGAARIIAMSGHPPRQKLAREFGTTDVVTERGDEGVDRVMQLTNGIGAEAVLECVGTQTRRCGVICLNSSIWSGTAKFNPGKVFDLSLPLDQVAEGYRAMDERRAIKALLRPAA
jgi:threonine dehydrogenase-like Zn-dependent dehydrogenase